MQSVVGQPSVHRQIAIAEGPARDVYLRVRLTYTQYVVVGDLDIDPVVACTSLEGEAIGQIQLPLGERRIVIRLEFGYPVPSVD